MKESQLCTEAKSDPAGHFDNGFLAHPPLCGSVFCASIESDWLSLGYHRDGLSVDLNLAFILLY